jgi:uncharacterized protein YggT (Ycf19 family)
MGLFVTDRVGLIIAFLNTVTFLLLIYMLLQAVGEPRSRVFRVLDRIFSPVLLPLRRILPKRGFDTAPLIAAAVLQLIAFAVKQSWF